MEAVKTLNSTVWATISPSSIHGVGVIAIRDIPTGTRISPVDRNVYTLSAKNFNHLHPAIQQLILDRTLFVAEKELLEFLSPNRSANLRQFMNHRDIPNSDGVVALSDIKAGDEITQDFRKAGSLHPLSIAHFHFL